MNLAEERKAVADLLNAGGVRAATHVPSDPKPPLAMVVPGSPYLAAADTFGGSRTLRLDVWLVAGTATNNAALTDTLDARIAEAIAILDADEWLLEDVQIDQWEPASGGKFPVAILGIQTTITS
ncbi:hypothetical protein M2317_000066 [Microbacterium sp. ZKA21]|uniref:hypothetical protein n=1 Tax=Microbacterium sp. ZKA21 TaxID=3381694 RepID=UPI003D1C70EC